MEIDAVGTFTMCHAALEYLKKGGPGKEPSSCGIIVNITATLHITATWYQIHVSAAKVGPKIHDTLNFAQSLSLQRVSIYIFFSCFYRRRLIVLRGAWH